MPLRQIFLTESENKKIKNLLGARSTARAAKDFARADLIRAALDAAGVTVMDQVGADPDWRLRPDFDPAKLDGIDA